MAGITSVVGVAAGFEEDLATGVAIDGFDAEAGVLGKGALCEPLPIVAARILGLVGVERAGVFSGDVGGTTAKTNGPLENGDAGSDSVEEAGRAMRKTDWSMSMSVGLSTSCNSWPSIAGLKRAGSVAVEVALSAVTCS